MNAIVYKSTGSWYTVADEKGRLFNARMKGAMKLEDITSTNPVAVGDQVRIEEEEGGAGYAVITEVLPRHNYINRQSPRHKRQHHIVAANLDQTMLVATLREPRTSQGFIDRFLLASEMYHVPPIIVFNKSDLYREKEMERYAQMRDMYQEAGYPVFLVSAARNSGLEELRSKLQGRITLVSGHSGVGKTSLLNLLLPGMDLRTKDISGWSGKGQHTTTFAEMFDLPGGGRIIDTPGMREFGLVDIEKQEVSHYFPEMRERLQECQFNNCLHLNEPGCAVKKAVQDGQIHPLRFESYVGILVSIEDPGY